MAKKSFKNSVTSAAAADRLYDAEPVKDDVQPQERAAAPGTQAGSIETRTKSKRAQFLLYPDLWDDVQRIAYVEQKTVNGLINELLEDYRQRNADKLNFYNEHYNK